MDFLIIRLNSDGSCLLTFKCQGSELFIIFLCTLKRSLSAHPQVRYIPRLHSYHTESHELHFGPTGHLFFDDKFFLLCFNCNVDPSSMYLQFPHLGFPHVLTVVTDSLFENISYAAGLYGDIRMQ